MATSRKPLWSYVRGLAAPVLLWCLFLGVLVQPFRSWQKGDEWYDESLIREWVEENRIFRQTLPALARDYLIELDRGAAEAKPDPKKNPDLAIQRRLVFDNLESMGNPPKIYSGQLPGFPIIYRLALTFDRGPEHEPERIEWDSLLARQASQYRELTLPLAPNRIALTVQYQLHAYNTRQQSEQAKAERVRWVGALALAGTIVAFLWIYQMQQHKRARERQHLLAQQQLDRAERRLLEQSLATQAAERQALELKSQLYASIGIMAGSYAHNIKNLLVRPNDLLRRCLETNQLAPEQLHMLTEVRQTLGTVTERLQQILRTVRRDPSRSELTRVDLNAMVRDLQRTWEELAREKWKLTLATEVALEPLWVEGDVSHLQQAVENLLFNARDATFEMRNRLREEAHQKEELASQDRRQALIAAAAWKGSVVLRTAREGTRAILEVRDNGIGMTDEVRRRCVETHFSTKRDNAIYEGNSTGMGLGLSFVVTILEHHHAKLELDSRPLHGASFRAIFPLTPAP
jgi:signal transduction histidine kinase